MVALINQIEGLLIEGCFVDVTKQKEYWWKDVWLLYKQKDYWWKDVWLLHKSEGLLIERYMVVLQDRKTIDGKM